MAKSHAAPWECSYAKESKSRCKPGKPPKSDHEYFEILCLCILQAGLSWGMVRNNWAKYKKGFFGFSISRLAKANPKELVRSPNVIRNLKKIEGIVCNAKEFQKIKKECGSFSNFLESLKLMKDKEAFGILMKNFRHVGPYTAEFYLHCVGYW